jgi:TfoX/Sxy family transcriptional regulator of competence genes
MIPGQPAGVSFDDRGQLNGWWHGPQAEPARDARFIALVSTIAVMGYDEVLAERIRELLLGASDVTEKKMFGGLAFLIGGNMGFAASGQGGLMVRVDPVKSDELVDTTNARFVEMRGRTMQGWLRVDSEDVRLKPQLAKWVSLGTTYARSLPAKR